MRAITFYDWMKAALYDPVHGYYQRSDRERWGRTGDYRTSPERSALFAATFARYFARLYEELGRPREWTIVECGAGGGDFAFGVLETLAQQFPSVVEATSYVVYDVSDDALRRTRERLVDFGDRVKFTTSFDGIGVDDGIFFSNELLDAFPVHRVVQTEQGLAELYVDGSSWVEEPLSTPRLAEFCAHYAPELAVGQVIEINLEIDEWFTRVASRLANGFVITVDYGAESTELYDATLRPNGTLRGFRRHEFVDDVLAKPGECDITASVNWTQVKTVGERVGLEVVDFASQDKFLLNAGLATELEYQLSLAKTDAERAALTTGARDMILPGGMASSFQVLVQRRVKEQNEDVA
ncbi:MAG TPA: SAM-dependent methyltransferase [Pyrinomonadaceae bacterium]|nr:SAM-dependent methyltransferase [Pyrinomonadaceae bacterium]